MSMLFFNVIIFEYISITIVMVPTFKTLVNKKKILYYK